MAVQVGTSRPGEGQEWAQGPRGAVAHLCRVRLLSPEIHDCRACEPYRRQVRALDSFLDGCPSGRKEGVAWDRKIMGTEAEGFAPAISWPCHLLAL